MELYSETLDPGETKDFAWDWSPKLAAGETVSTQTVAWIDRAGTTSPSDSVASNISRVWLAVGTPGGRAIWTITAQTNQGRTFEAALAVDVVVNAYAEPGGTELDRLAALKAALQDAALTAVTGSVVEVWNGRYGNKMKYQSMKYAEIQAALVEVDRLISAEQSVAAGGPRRGAVGLLWKH